MITHKDEQTIIAQCTPQGSGAIALLRITGSHAIDIADKMAQLSSKKSLKSVKSHTVHYGSIINDKNEIIDKVMFIVMHAPRTFTGQDTVEITSHNNPFIIQDIINQAIEYGARIAQKGEFAQRAFESGKIDLVQAEAINDLIHAHTQMALKKSLQQLEGSFSHWIKSIENKLTRALAWCQASFEFLDEHEQDDTFDEEIKQTLQALSREISELKATFNQQQQIKQGIKIALVGSVNAGKSSIFNALLNQKRSIVTDIEGTTRDSVEAGIYRHNNYWTLVDTAGLRQTQDIVEQEGIKRSFEEAQKADIILIVFDGSRDLSEQEWSVYKDLIDSYAHKSIIIHNKSDLPQSHDNKLIDKAHLSFSSMSKEGLEELNTLIEDRIQDILSKHDSPFLLNQRQYNLIVGLEQKIKTVIEMVRHTPQYELVSYHLNDALEYITELTGKTISEAGMDTVFKEFCVGK
jgi:tRNA modification GTPase